MKKCKNITCWTDYPFTELGDTPNKLAQIRRVLVSSYDGNKYATVCVGGTTLELKCGYMYSQPGRLGKVKTINRRKLERMISSY